MRDATYSLLAFLLASMLACNTASNLKADGLIVVQCSHRPESLHDIIEGSAPRHSVGMPDESL
jgi:hypothetical protein